MPHRLWTTLAPPTTRPSATRPCTMTGWVTPHDGQFTVAGERRRKPVDLPGPEGDRWVLAGAEDRLEGLVDLGAVSVAEWLDATGSFPDFQRIGVNLHGHRGVGRGGRVDGGATTPAGDLESEIVAGLGAQPCPSRVDQEPARLGSEPVGTGDPHSLKATPTPQRPLRGTGHGHDGRSRGAQARPWAAHMVHPSALSVSLRRRPVRRRSQGGIMLSDARLAWSGALSLASRPNRPMRPSSGRPPSIT